MKRITSSCYLFCAFALVTSNTCKPSLSYEEFNAQEQKYFVAYSTDDVHQAEITLLDGLNWVSNCERQHKIPGVVFPAHEAMFHERLFLIYEAAHDTNKMESELRQSIDCINRSCQSQGVPAMTDSMSVVAGKIHNLDNGKNIRWKTNTVADH